MIISINFKNIVHFFIAFFILRNDNVYLLTTTIFISLLVSFYLLNLPFYVYICVQKSFLCNISINIINIMIVIETKTTNTSHTEEEWRRNFAKRRWVARAKFVINCCSEKLSFTNTLNNKHNKDICVYMYMIIRIACYCCCLL